MPIPELAQAVLRTLWIALQQIWSEIPLLPQLPDLHLLEKIALYYPGCPSARLSADVSFLHPALADRLDCSAIRIPGQNARFAEKCVQRARRNPAINNLLHNLRHTPDRSKGAEPSVRDRFYQPGFCRCKNVTGIHCNRHLHHSECHSASLHDHHPCAHACAVDKISMHG